MRILLQKQQQQGIAIVIVMLVIMTLSTLAAGFALSMKVEMRLAAQANFDQQLQWLGRSGAELSCFILTETEKSAVPRGIHSLNQKWAGGQGSEATNGPLADIPMENIELGTGLIKSITITDLERKFNINSIPFKPMLMQQAVMVMGVDASTSPEITDAISDWIDADDNARSSGAENQYYLGLNPPYYCKNAMVDEMPELLLVKGITPDIFWGTSSTNNTVSRYQPRDLSPSQRNKQPVYECGLYDLFSTLSAGKINVNTAPLNTLRMVFNGDENIARAVISERDKGSEGGPDGGTAGSPFLNIDDIGRRVPGLGDRDKGQLNNFCAVRSATFEAVIEVAVGDYTRTFVAVLIRSGNNKYIVLTFHEK